MAHHQITLDDQVIQAQAGQKDDALAVLVQQVLKQVLEAQVADQLQYADRYERTEARQGHRNGSRTRQLTTRVGTLTLQVPQTRDGKFSPALFERCQTHLMCNILDAAPKAVQSALHAHIRPIFEAPDRATAQTLWDTLVKDFGQQASRALAVLEDGLDDALAVLQHVFRTQKLASIAFDCRN